ncbi:hypothetical protein AB6E89_08275 [Vibrio breoganii]
MQLKITGLSMPDQSVTFIPTTIIKNNSNEETSFSWLTGLYLCCNATLVKPTAPEEPAVSAGEATAEGATPEKQMQFCTGYGGFAHEVMLARQHGNTMAEVFKVLKITDLEDAPATIIKDAYSYQIQPTIKTQEQINYSPKATASPI